MTRGRTALLAATHGNHVAVARALIAAGADVNAKDDIQDSPFLYAGAEGRTEILKMTLAAGADLKSTNRYGGTALIPAAHHGHPEAVRILLGTAIDKDHVNRLGWTALLEAVILGDGGPVHTEIVRLLVEAGANVNIADREGVTPLRTRRRRGFREMVRILESRGRALARVPRPDPARPVLAAFRGGALGGAVPVVGDDAERDLPRVGGLARVPAPRSARAARPSPSNA